MEAEFGIDTEFPPQVGPVKCDRGFRESDGLADGRGRQAFSDQEQDLLLLWRERGQRGMEGLEAGPLGVFGNAP